jgi:polysaccharide chain length determinant protein (PEP-CTERM system associated)
VAPSAKLSQDITAQLTSLFIDENLRTRQQRSEDTTSFLENQLSEAKKSLQDQESKIQMFKSQYGGQLPSQSGLNGGSLSAMQGRLQSLNESLNQAEQQQISLESLSAQYHAIHNHGTDDGLAKMKAELADLRGKYTENHPDVKRLKQQIAAIESKNASATGNDPKASESSPGSYADLAEMAPVIQIDNQLRSNKLDVESKRRQIKALESQIAGFQGRLMTAPLREQQLAELTRDYDQSRTYYESLLNKKNQSELATNLERRQQGEQFRLLDPASLPTKPSFPDRMKMSLWGLLVGILFAGAAVAISEAMDDKVYNEKELKEIVSARVLASIPPMPTAAEQQLHTKRSRQEYLVSAAALAVIVLAFLISFYRG